MIQHTIACPHCGQPLPGEAAFCPHCAKSIRLRQPYPIPLRRWRRRWMAWAVLAAILAVLTVCFWPWRATTVSVFITEDATGTCVVDRETVQTYLPQATVISFNGANGPDTSLEDVLISSFQMATLIVSNGKDRATGEWGYWTPDDNPSAPYSLLIFDSGLHLMGYFIGIPQPAGENRWELKVTLCDYDITPLYQQQLAAFQAERSAIFTNFIPPERVADCGAAWFLKGYSTGHSGILIENDPQAYYLWTTYRSPSLERWRHPLEQLPQHLPDSSRWMCYLLLDAHNGLIGYTMLDHQGTGLTGSLTERT